MLKLDKDKYLPWLAVIFCGAVVALLGKVAAEERGFSMGASWLVFLLILIGVAVAYMLFNAVWEPLFEKLFGKILTPKQNPRNTPDTPEHSALGDKIESFCRYSDEALGGYVAEDDLKRLHTYIAQYAKGNMGDVPQRIGTTGLEKYELLHYAWNIWNHFGVALQPETAQWLVNVFVIMKDSDPNAIYKKFTHNEKYAYKIELKDKIE